MCLLFLSGRKLLSGEASKLREYRKYQIIGFMRNLTFYFCCFVNAHGLSNSQVTPTSHLHKLLLDLGRKGIL